MRLNPQIHGWTSGHIRVGVAATECREKVPTYIQVLENRWKRHNPYKPQNIGGTASKASIRSLFFAIVVDHTNNK